MAAQVFLATATVAADAGALAAAGITFADAACEAADGRVLRTLDGEADREVEQALLLLVRALDRRGLAFDQLRLDQPLGAVGGVAQQLRDALLRLRDAGDVERLAVLLDGGDVDPFGHLLDELVEHMHRHVAVDLEVFDRLLARLQRSDLRLQAGDVLDLDVELGDSQVRNCVAVLLPGDQLLNDQVPDADDRRADDGGDRQPGEERDFLAPAPLLAVRQQVDHDHCANLRIARPQAVRYDDASRRSLASRTAEPSFMFSNGLTTIEAKPVSSVTRSFRPGSVAVPPASIT
jgi:hypothetical protein